MQPFFFEFIACCLDVPQGRLETGREETIQILNRDGTVRGVAYLSEPDQLATVRELMHSPHPWVGNTSSTTMLGLFKDMHSNVCRIILQLEKEGAHPVHLARLAHVMQQNGIPLVRLGYIPSGSYADLVRVYLNPRDSEDFALSRYVHLLERRAYFGSVAEEVHSGVEFVRRFREEAKSKIEPTQARMVPLSTKGKPFRALGI